jgi:hypothetical protein
VVADKSVGVDPDEADPPSVDTGTTTVVERDMPDVQCAGTPVTGEKENFRHFSSQVVASLGDERHRGIDLVASADDTVQEIRGEASYGLLDDAIEDEDVDVYACRKFEWVFVGTGRTDDEGRFVIPVSDDARLPIGVRDMYLSVRGDRTGTRFLAVVGYADTQLAVSDVDGTLTTSEDAFASEIIDVEPDIHPGAAAAWRHVASTGRIPVDVTARPRMFTDDTRTWLAARDMPRGVLRLAPGVLLPGDATAHYKADTLEALPLPLGIGVGNRATDIEAYQAAGLAPAEIFVKLPEFSDEVAPYLAAGDAIGFSSYPGPL